MGLFSGGLLSDEFFRLRLGVLFSGGGYYQNNNSFGKNRFFFAEVGFFLIAFKLINVS